MSAIHRERKRPARKGRPFALGPMEAGLYAVRIVSAPASLLFALIAA